jgi:microcystin-dependent protein
MVDPTTQNTSMFVPLRGADVGTWDVPVNSNFNALDAMLGTVTNISPTNLPITLTTAQSQAAIIRLNGTLTGNVAITMSGIYKKWTVENLLTNSPSSFCVTFVSTTAVQQIGIPPGLTDVYYDAIATSVRFANLPLAVGSYWDYAGSAVPSWNTACSVPPYLNCDGSAFSSATYPTLCNLFGGTGFNILPDARGRYRATLNQTTGRITTAGGGVDGNTLIAVGGIQNVTLGSSNLPASILVNDPGHHHGFTAGSSVTLFALDTGGGSFAFGSGFNATFQSAITSSATTGITVNPSSSPAGTGNFFQSLPPSYVGGITMIRAA